MATYDVYWNGDADAVVDNINNWELASGAAPVAIPGSDANTWNVHFVDPLPIGGSASAVNKPSTASSNPLTWSTLEVTQAYDTLVGGFTLDLTDVTIGNNCSLEGYPDILGGHFLGDLTMTPGGTATGLTDTIIDGNLIYSGTALAPDIDSCTIVGDITLVDGQIRGTTDVSGAAILSGTTIDGTGGCAFHGNFTATNCSMSGAFTVDGTSYSATATIEDTNGTTILDGGTFSIPATINGADGFAFAIGTLGQPVFIEATTINADDVSIFDMDCGGELTVLAGSIGGGIYNNINIYDTHNTFVDGGLTLSALEIRVYNPAPSINSSFLEKCTAVYFMSRDVASASSDGGGFDWPNGAAIPAAPTVTGGRLSQTDVN